MKTALIGGCIAIGTAMIYSGIEMLNSIAKGELSRPVPIGVGWAFIAFGIGFIVAPFAGMWLTKKDVAKGKVGTSFDEN